MAVPSVYGGSCEAGGNVVLLTRPLAILLFVPLVAVLVARGIAPALTRVGTDFPSYLTAAEIVVDRGPAERLYDDPWFQEQMRRYGIGEPSQGKFTPFPPPTALLLTPLAPLSPLTALRVLTLVSVLALGISIALLARTLGWRMIESAVWVLLSGSAVLNALKLGQPYILIAALCIAGYYAYLVHRPLWAGICFGLFAPLKYFPAVFLLYFAFRKEWRIVLGGALAMIGVAALSVGVLGWKVHEIFLSSVLGHHLVAEISLQDPFSAGFQSFDTLLRRLFVYDPSLNPHPWTPAPLIDFIGIPLIKLALVGAAVATLTKLSRNDPDRTVAPSLGILGLLTLLIAPATATYHFVLLWLPVGLLVEYFLAHRMRPAAIMLVFAYALIGFFPYRLTAGFEGRGGLTLLAYPRLFLLAAMFAVSIGFLWRRPQPAPPAATPEPACCT
jgi:hypothetical protein